MVPAAKAGDFATVLDCLSKMANIDVKVVRPMYTCNVFLMLIRSCLFH